MHAPLLVRVVREQKHMSWMVSCACPIRILTHVTLAVHNHTVGVAVLFSFLLRLLPMVLCVCHNVHSILVISMLGHTDEVRC